MWINFSYDKFMQVVLSENSCINPAAFTCLKLTIEALEEGVKYVQN